MKFSRIRRGLFRVWLVLSLAWGAFVLAVQGQDDLFDFAIVPAFVVLVFGASLLWALSGFRKDDN